MTCPTCDGKGEVCISCCTGDVVKGDIKICPECFEHLGEETCPDCNGTGEVEEDTPLIDTIDPQAIAENRAEQLKDFKI